MKTTTIKEVKARILHHRRIGAKYFRLRLHCPEMARMAQPGQFMMLRVSELRDPFLRRPFSFSRIFPPQEKKRRPEDEGALEIYYQVVGRGTSLMTRLKRGQRLDLLGPLGNGFRSVEGAKQAILLGGGIGIAPLLSWAVELRRRRGKGKPFRSPDEAPEVLVLICAKTREKILAMGEFKKIGIEPQVATEDGRMGIRGLATDLLEQELLTKERTGAALYVCGPPAMLSKAAQIAAQFDLPCQVLLEARMACGMGACLGCAVKIKDKSAPGTGGLFAEVPQLAAGNESCEKAGNSQEGMQLVADWPRFRYARACKDGPVFEAREIIWE